MFAHFVVWYPPPTCTKPLRLCGTNRSPLTDTIPFFAVVPTGLLPLVLTPYPFSAVVPTGLPPFVPTPYSLSLVVPLGRPRRFRLHPHTQRLRATCTSTPHCGHDLKLRVLIVICSTLSHSTLSACSSRLLVGFSEAFKRRSTSQFNFRSSWISSGSGSGS